MDKINNIGLSRLLTSVYDFDGFNEQEVWCRIAQKINIIIEHFNYLDKKIENEKENNKAKFDYLLGEGLTETVAKIILEKIADGTIGELLNNTLLKDINDKVEKNSSDIAILKNEKYIFIGDSYGEGYTPQGNVTSWIDYTNQLMHLSNDDVYSYAVGGYGFTTGGFQELINRAVAEISDKADIKYIVVGGGYNDSWNYSNIASSMKTFFDTCRVNFPNAKVIIAPFGWCVEGLTTDVHVTQTFSNLIHMVLEYQRNAVINGGCYVDGIYSVLHKNDFFSSDYVHPNNNGQYAIGLAMANYLKGNGFSTIEYMNNENVFLNNVYEEGINVTCQCIATVENKSTLLHLTSGKITGAFTDKKLDGSSILLGAVKSAVVNGCYEKTLLPAKGVLKTHDSHYYDIDFTLYISHNKLYMNITKVNDTNDDFLTLSFVEINVNSYSVPVMINSLIN